MPFDRLRKAARLSTTWLTCPSVPWSERLAHLPRSLVARGRGVHRITYLGRPFEYDNPDMPIIIQQFPDFVARCVLGNVRHEVETVLDVGGNLGQFTTTLHSLAPAIRAIDVFEPNVAIVDHLRRNTAGLAGVRVFEAGVGPGGERDLWYTPTKSATASVIRDNAANARGAALERLRVPMVDDVAALTGRSAYDLIKVDVEGDELGVVRALTGLSTRYLLIEVTGPAKQRPFRTSELYQAIAEQFGPFDTRYQSSSEASSTIFDVLLEFPDGGRQESR